MRITHLPTGIVVAMQDESSQLQNRDKAMRVLRARLFEAERARQEPSRRGAQGAGRLARPLREDPHLQLPAGPRHRSSDRGGRPLADVLAGNLDDSSMRSPPGAKRRALEGGDA